MTQSAGKPTVAELIAQGGLRAALPVRHVAGLILTYRCSIACKHCLFSCSTAAGPAMTEDQAACAIAELHATGRVVHVAGGEALLYPRVVLEACRRAAAAGRGAHFIETNASWAVSDELVRRRLDELARIGLAGVLISADLYHQQFVPAERFCRLRRIAREVFGPQNVLSNDADDAAIAELERRAKDPAELAVEVQRWQPRLVGRAAAALAGLLPLRPIEQLADDPMWKGQNDGMGCRREFDAATMWEIHIDPYDNIQTCCGVILGRLADGSVVDQARAGWPFNPLVAILREQGPTGLIPLALQRGYRLREAYPQKCYLCYELRHFLRPHFEQYLGPAEVYAERPALAAK